MSDEYTKTVVIRDRSQVPGAALPNRDHRNGSVQKAPDAPKSGNEHGLEYPDFEDTSWLT